MNVESLSARNAQAPRAPLPDPVVFVLDDDLSVRESLESLILSCGWKTQTFASAEEFLRYARPARASCLILDLHLPGENGLQLQQRIAADAPEMPIIFITAYGNVPTSVRAMKAGAVEFLTKPLSDDALLVAIAEALARSRATLAREAEMRAVRARYALLSGREKDVMRLVATGLLNKRVAFELRISEITVKAHRGRVMRKMGAGSLADLVRMAAKLYSPV
jgi:FixJ family two-component response regulator